MLSRLRLKLISIWRSGSNNRIAIISLVLILTFAAGDFFGQNRVRTPIDEALSKLAKVVKEECAKNKLTHPKISIEPGRAIIGPTTTTLYEVGTTKNIELDGGKNRHYISVDGGMSDNLRPGLYGAKYMAILANRTSKENEIDSRIVGKHCETGDIVVRDIQMPSDVKPGDLLAIPATGAYGRSMANNYNHMTKPAVVAVSNGKARLILRRETNADLLALDVSESLRELS